jgi:hypothetical protein
LIGANIAWLPGGEGKGTKVEITAAGKRKMMALQCDTYNGATTAKFFSSAE